MEIGMIGLGRMGANMVRRLLKADHRCVVYDRSTSAVQTLVDVGAIGASSLNDLIQKLSAPRAIWLMIPAALVDSTLGELSGMVSANDIIIDGGNSYYIDDIRRSRELKAKGVQIKLEPFATPVCRMAIVLDPEGNAVGLHQLTD